MPWTSHRLAGFPTTGHVKMSCLSQVVEDLPQLAIQIISAHAKPSIVTHVSITLTIFSLLANGLKKVRPYIFATALRPPC